MKKSILSVLSLFAVNFAFSQNIGINATGATPDASAILDVSSTTKGMLIPRMTTADRTAITSPAIGLVVYDTNLNSFYYYNGTSWQWLLNSASGWNTTGNASTVAGTNFIGTTDAIDFVTKTNNAEVMRVTSGGNVGIGTSTPTYKLDISGSQNNLRLQASAANDYPRMFFSSTHVSVGGVINRDAAKDIYFGESSDAGKWIFRGTGALTVEGSVGIGTTTPGAKLDVAGQVKITGGTPGTGKVLISDATGLATWATPGTATGAWGILGNASTVAGTNFIGTTDAIDFVTKTNNTEVMRITSAGAVGIGTSAPIAKLEVVGKLYSTGAGAECSAQDRTNGTQYTMYGSGGVMRLWRGDFGDIIGMTSAGDVGINTTAPANKLHVNSASNTSYVQTSNANTGATATDGAVFGLFNSNAYLYNRENADLYFGTNNTRRMTITAGGNVGIGTAVITPSVPLAVGGVGANVYGTDIWAENNIHVQGNEGLLVGGRGRLRVGTAWNYVGLYSEGSSTGATNDLVLGASSSWVRIGPNGGGQSLYISNGQLLLGADNAQKPSTSTWIITSDERLKTINGSYTKGLAEILKLNTITYKYKNVGEKKFDEKVLATTQVGFSAQEVQKIFPEAVGEGEDGYLNLNMHAILVAYTNAIKELDAKNKEQEKINSELKQRLEKLEALLEKTK